MICLIFFAVFYFFFLINMFKMHNYEAKRHLSKYSIIVLCFCTGLVIESWLGLKLYKFSTISFKNLPENYCLDGRCNRMLFGFICKVNWAESVPFFAFLFVSQIYPPHDCFKCFGKDPDRRYSIQ